MASEHYSIKLEAFNITCHQLTLPTTMVVPVPVRPVNKTRPFSHGALILKVIKPLHENRIWPCETNTHTHTHTDTHTLQENNYPTYPTWLHYIPLSSLLLSETP